MSDLPDRISVDVTDPDCEDCDGTGHDHDCESREPAWDLMDLMCRRACSGCCPRGHLPQGLQAAQDRATFKTQRLVDPKRIR
jgi:hypothetical protein